MKKLTLLVLTLLSREAGGGGAGGARAPPKFGISVNPIRTKGGRLCPPYYYWPPHLFGRCGASVMLFKLPDILVRKKVVHVLKETVYS